MNLNLSPVELSLVGAAVNEKITWLDGRYELLLALAEASDLPVDLETNRVMRIHYAGIVRRIEQLLDVPFTDDAEARRLLEAGTVVMAGVAG